MRREWKKWFYLITCRKQRAIEYSRGTLTRSTGGGERKHGSKNRYTSFTRTGGNSSTLQRAIDSSTLNRARGSSSGYESSTLERTESVASPTLVETCMDSFASTGNETEALTLIEKPELSTREFIVEDQARGDVAGVQFHARLQSVAEEEEEDFVFMNPIFQSYLEDSESKGTADWPTPLEDSSHKSLNELADAEEGYALRDGVEDPETSAELHKQGLELSIFNPVFIDSDSEAPEESEKPEPQPEDIALGVISSSQPDLTPETHSLPDMPFEGLLPPSLSVQPDLLPESPSLPVPLKVPYLPPLSIPPCGNLLPESSFHLLPLSPDSQADAESQGPAAAPLLSPLSPQEKREN